MTQRTERTESEAGKVLVTLGARDMAKLDALRELYSKRNPDGALPSASGILTLALDELFAQRIGAGRG